MTTPKDMEEIAYDRLTGKHKHYCIEWDFMAIDETCPEFLACTCFDDLISPNEWNRIQKNLRDYIMIEDKRLEHAE